ncbi:hypothetical protein Bca4012_098723 [Brassica carinata]
MLEKQEPESSSSSEEAQAVTPWVVSGNVDHEKVIENFSCDRIDDEDEWQSNQERGEQSNQDSWVSGIHAILQTEATTIFSETHCQLSSHEFDLANREAMDESAEWRRMFDCEAEKASKCNSELALENAALLSKIETLKQELEASRL